VKRFLLGLLILVVCLPSGCRRDPGSLPPIEIRFSPNGGCTEAIADEIRAAENSILVQAYSFTSAPIAEAIVAAHKRGVRVDVILDKSQRTEKYSSADFVQHAGIPVRIDSHHAIAHNKIMILDGHVVITGSFNFTKHAEENNAENLLIIRDAGIAGQYTANWHAHAEHSEPYVGKGPQAGSSGDRADPSPAGAEDGESAQEGYVSSANSQVFHDAHCRSAAKIAAANRVVYRTREAAIAAGKKPCHECNP